MKLFTKPRRQKQTAKYRTLVWSPPLKGIAQPIDSFGRLVLSSARQLRRHWPVFSLLLVIFLLGAGFLFWGFGGQADLAGRQEQLEIIHGAGWLGQLTIAANQLQHLGQLLLENTDFNFYLGVWLIFLSLIVIHVRRQLQKKPPASLKLQAKLALDSLYFGPAQIVPFCLVLAFLVGQILPALLANAVATDLRLGGLLDSNASQLIALSVVVLIGWLSFYLASGSVFGLIIATRTGVRPAAAWQTSWDLTIHRRAQAAAFLAGGFLLGLAATALVMLPVLIFLLPWATIIFNAWLIALAIWWHLYFFELYQSLIKPAKRPAHD